VRVMRPSRRKSLGLSSYGFAAKESKMRNPRWTRDEVILALDLFIRSERRQLSASHAEVIALSQTMQRLPYHPPEARDASFRNPNGISMILGNFLGIDPDYEGSGLGRNNQLQQEVWDELAGSPDKLRRLAQAIVAAIDLVGPLPAAPQDADEDAVFLEGELLTRLHTQRERDPRVVARKKGRVLRETGRLSCEVCSFDFEKTYGQLGRGFAECHHRVPLAELPFARETRLADLAIVCANCHRMLHRARPTLGIAELKAIIDASV
jgi:5-methylcytosine-specific restriction enzyme A